MLILCKKPVEKTPNIREMRPFWILVKTASMQRPLQNLHFGSKNQISKNISKTSLQGHYTISMQKTARKNTYYSRNETILNIGQNGLHTKAIAFAKSSLGSKNKIAKNLSKTNLQAHYTNSMQKNAWKNTYNSRNETILNIGQNGLHAKAIAFAKS